MTTLNDIYEGQLPMQVAARKKQNKRSLVPLGQGTSTTFFGPVAHHPYKKYILVANGGTLYKIDTTTKQITQITAAFGGDIHDIKFTLDGAFAFVVGMSANVAVFTDSTALIGFYAHGLGVNELHAVAIQSNTTAIAVGGTTVPKMVLITSAGVCTGKSLAATLTTDPMYGETKLIACATNFTNTQAATILVVVGYLGIYQLGNLGPATTYQLKGRTITDDFDTVTNHYASIIYSSVSGTASWIVISSDLAELFIIKEATWESLQRLNICISPAVVVTTYGRLRENVEEGRIYWDSTYGGSAFVCYYDFDNKKQVNFQTCSGYILGMDWNPDEDRLFIYAYKGDILIYRDRSALDIQNDASNSLSVRLDEGGDAVVNAKIIGTQRTEYYVGTGLAGQTVTTEYDRKTNATPSVKDGSGAPLTLVTSLTGQAKGFTNATAVYTFGDLVGNGYCPALGEIIEIVFEPASITRRLIATLTFTGPHVFGADYDDDGNAGAGTDVDINGYDYWAIKMDASGATAGANFDALVEDADVAARLTSDAEAVTVLTAIPTPNISSSRNWEGLFPLLHFLLGVNTVSLAAVEHVHFYIYGVKYYRI
jgi:hypothetical protein